MSSSRFVFPSILVASLAITLGLFWNRLGDRGPRVHRLPEVSVPIPALAQSRQAPEPAPSAATPAPSVESKSACASGMVLVEGEHCPFVAHKCKDKRKDSDVCETYANEVLCEGTIRSARFCIDELEYPNLSGVKPVVLVNYGEAKRACDVEDKRLCTIDEWQFACEGQAILPLPTGVERSSKACNVDRPDPAPVLGALHDPFSVASEMMRIDGRVTSGSLPCASPFGVRDLVGNVEEWAENPEGTQKEKPFRSAIVGGAWGNGVAACRTVDTDTPETFTSHHRGFRCCSDATPLPPGHPTVAPHKSRGGFRPLQIGRG